MTGSKLAMQSCTAFTVNLASRTLLPGGGSAAALVGALSVSLCQMVSSLAVRKKRFAACKEELQHIIHQADFLREEFLQLMDEDMAAFEPLVRAYALPRRTPGYADILENAALTASRVPYRMMERCCDAIRLLEGLQDKCSPSLISDVGCAALAARSALECASLNVFVNTRLLPGDEEAGALSEAADALLESCVPRAQAVADAVMRTLKTPKN